MEKNPIRCCSASFVINAKSAKPGLDPEADPVFDPDQDFDPEPDIDPGQDFDPEPDFDPDPHTDCKKIQFGAWREFYFQLEA